MSKTSKKNKAFKEDKTGIKRGEEHTRGQSKVVFNVGLIGRQIIYPILYFFKKAKRLIKKYRTLQNNLIKLNKR